VTEFGIMRWQVRFSMLLHLGKGLIAMLDGILAITDLEGIMYVYFLLARAPRLSVMVDQDAIQF
jgi:hypothetical protein